MSDLVYLSFNPTLHLIYTPETAKVNSSAKGILKYPYRLMYPDLLSAVWAIYPAALKRMHTNSEESMDLYAYKTSTDGLTGIVDNDLVVKNRLIEDAHISKAIIVPGAAPMVKTNWYRIYKDHETKGSLYNPFNDKKLDLRFRACTDKIDTIATY